MSSLRRTQLVASGVIGAIAIAITLGAYFGHSLRSLEQKSVDSRFSIRGSDGAPKGVVAVAIDDATFAKLHEQWPFPRCQTAQVLDQIARGHPSAVAIDLQFTEQSTAVDSAGVRCDVKLA